MVHYHYRSLHYRYIIVPLIHTSPTCMIVQCTPLLCTTLAGALTPALPLPVRRTAAVTPVSSSPTPVYPAAVRSRACSAGGPASSSPPAPPIAAARCDSGATCDWTAVSCWSLQRRGRGQAVTARSLLSGCGATGGSRLVGRGWGSMGGQVIMHSPTVLPNRMIPSYMVVAE